MGSELKINKTEVVEWESKELLEYVSLEKINEKVHLRIYDPETEQSASVLLKDSDSVLELIQGLKQL